MKHTIIEEPVTVTSIKQVHKYTCEYCGFETQDHWDAREHDASHAFRAKECAGNKVFFWFETKENLDLWIKAYPHDRNGSIAFSSPGWYLAEEWVDSYDDTVLDVFPIWDVEKKYVEEIQKMNKELKEIVTLMNTCPQEK